MTTESGGHVLATSRGAFHVRLDGASARPWLTVLHALAADLHMWDAQVPGWCEHFRVLRVDMRGHGRTPWTGGTEPVGIDELARDVLAVWDAVGVWRSVVVGLSIGGMIALDLAVGGAEQVVAVVAADCRADAPPGFRAMWDRRLALLLEGGMAAVAEATLPTWFTPRTLAEQPERFGAVRAMIARTSPPGYAALARGLQQLDLASRLGAIDVPVLLVVGADDGVHEVAMRAMAQLMPGTALVTIAGAAHLVNLEQAQAFAAATDPFLRSFAADASPAVA
jgi:3-oxoadipate enol-lactonase